MDDRYTDQALWELMRNDETAAFEEIYNRYSKRMFTYAANVLHKQDVCEDIIQDVFVDFWSKRKTAQITNIKPYLFQSVKFQLLKHMRSQRISDEDLTRLNIIDVSLDVSQHLELAELEALIRDRVNKLSPKCQQVFVMSRYDFKSNKEIALELGVTEQAVKNQISKALKFIRQELYPQEIILLLFFLLIF
ncbi:RNA polymerase sigma-70 factor [Parapedobacter lycopersici]|uniref:RNA polymerase sigma-70 factor n=1 Tax=Parapedobacter lycopersici TaxID=1864939 RepID=UPI00214DCAC0|nr:RNA polymerase sigma-70 factor [Parapedobacter lycopersici]